MPIGRHVLLAFLDVTLVEEGGAYSWVVAPCGSRRGGGRVPGQLPPALQAQVHIHARPSMEGQGIEKPLHRIEDPLEIETHTYTPT